MLPISVLLIDDHLIIRSGLKHFISKLFPNSIIDESYDGDSAIAKFRQRDYSLIIMDVNMPGTDSFALVNNMLAQKPEAKILMFSMNPENTYAKRYLKMGVMGYLSKNAEEAEITKAITAVLNNKRYISTSLAKSLADGSFSQLSVNPFDNLSTREFEVAQHLMKGKGITQICKELNLDSSTVSSHKRKIFEKLHVSNMVDMTELARVYNLL